VWSKQVEDVSSHDRWTVAVRVLDPQRVRISGRGPTGTRWSETTRLPKVASEPAAVVLGFAHALTCLRGRGVGAVRLVVRDATLTGYLRRGWRPRSVDMVLAIRALVEAAVGLSVTFDLAHAVRVPRPGSDE
jgi:hypothetical protein